MKGCCPSSTLPPETHDIEYYPSFPVGLILKSSQIVGTIFVNLKVSDGMNYGLTNENKYQLI
jgi:hypothetical protein